MDQSPGHDPKSGPHGITDPGTLVGREIGGFRIAAVLASGSSGTVCQAVQKSPQREVALKLSNAARISDRALRHFERESRILGLLRHPGIAQILTAGIHRDGGPEIPFIAMELIRGRPLLEHCGENRLSLEERLQLFCQVCAAVQHAHAKGIVHRDLKPANILVGDDGRPRIVDFGLARATGFPDSEDTLAKQRRRLAGTIAYMSPEQTTGRPEEVDARSDVYALGVILFELLADRLPYPVGGKPLMEAIRIIQETDSTRLAAVDRAYAGDLQTIVAKALEKDSDRRYQTTAGFASDIRRFLTGQPIEARPPAKVYRLRKFVRRNRAWVVGLVSIAAILILTISGTSLGLLRARLNEDRARRAERQAALTKDFIWQLVFASNPRTGRGAESTIREILDALAERTIKDLQGDPELLADQQLALGQTYRSLRVNEQAELHLKQALASRRRAFECGLRDDSSLELAEALKEVGVFQLHNLGRPQDAAEALRECVEILERDLGPGHPELFEPLLLLATAELRSGADQNAKSSRAWALEIFQASGLEEEHRHVLCLRYHIESVLDGGAEENAESLLRQVLPVVDRAAGSSSIALGLLYQSLAEILAKTGKNDKAVEYRTRVANMRARRTGERGVDLEVQLTWQAETALLQRDLVLASVLHDDLLELRRKTYGDHSEEVGRTLFNIGKLRHLLGHKPEAWQAFEEALAIRDAATGGENPRGGAFDHQTVLDFLYSRQDAAGCAALLPEYIRRCRAHAGGPSDLEILRRSSLGKSLFLCGRHEDAVRELKAAAELMESSSLHSPHVLAVMDRYRGWSLIELNRLEAAEKALQRSLTTHTRIFPTGHFDIQITRLVLGQLYLRAGRLEEARETMAPALGTSSARLPEQTWLRALLEALEGEFHARCGDAEKARSLFRSSIAHLRVVLRQDDPRLQRWTARLSALEKGEPTDRGRPDRSSASPTTGEAQE